MATSSELKSQVDELTKCPICLEDLVNPKSLPCLHTFCLRCIQGHLKDKLPGDTVNCPICRESFQVPHQGIEHLPDNFFINSLIDVMKLSAKSLSAVSCDGCCDDSDLMASNVSSSATTYCTGCGQKLCDRCSKPHQRIPGGGHEVKPLGHDAIVDTLKLQRTFCGLHAGNKLELYCKDCGINVCVTCHLTKHKGHEYEDVNVVSEIFRQQLQDHIKQATNKERHIVEEASSVEVQHREFLIKLENIEKGITETAAELKKRIDKAVKQLTDELTDVKTTASKAVSGKKNELEFQLLALKSFTRYSRELVKSGKPCDIITAHKTLEIRVKQLLEQEDESSWRLPEIVITPDAVFDKISGYVVENSLRKYT
jgi:hypothetical protein